MALPLAAVATELARCKLYLVGVQEVGRNTWGTARAGNCIFFMENETSFITWEKDFVNWIALYVLV